MQQLCPDCRVGKTWLELDPGNPECPYISMNNGKFCVMFEKLETKNHEDFSNPAPVFTDGE